MHCNIKRFSLQIGMMAAVGTVSSCCFGQVATEPAQAPSTKGSKVVGESSTELLPESLQSEPSGAITGDASVTQQSAEATKFLRLTHQAGEPKSLDVAIVRYGSETPGGIEVDLISAVHIGETAYYNALNRLFDRYDVLLYELVAPEGTKIPLGGQREASGFNPVAMLQDTSKEMLGLESQLEKIDYTKSHFVRADMTPQQIADKMADRGDTVFTLALSTFADMLRNQNRAALPAAEQLTSNQDMSLLDMFGNPLKMKRLLAEQFASNGSLDLALGSALNQLLVVDRNQQALKVLQKQMAAGKRKIGIFYGAAHMPDFEHRLVDDFGLQRQSVRWIAAWDLTTAKQPDLAEPATQLLNFLRAFE